MNTMITIGYNPDSFRRKMRLMNAFQAAGDMSESNFADLQNKVAGLSDSDGELTVVWAILPTSTEIDAFRKTWVSVGGKDDAVTHVWFGVPDKPIVKSAKADLSSLNQLCKKLADTYYRQYLEVKEKPTSQPNNSDIASGKGSKTAYEPEWNEMQNEYLRQINDNA